MKLQEKLSWISTTVVVCCAFAALAAPIFGPDSAKKTGELAISLVAAAGTLLAVIVSLYLAQKSDRQHEAKERHVAVITANKLHPVIQELCRAVNQCKWLVNQASTVDGHLLALPDRLLYELQEDLLDVHHEDLVRLSALKGRSGVEIAAATNLLKLLRNQVVRSKGKFLASDPEECAPFLKHWLSTLSLTQTYLGDAKKVLRASCLNAETDDQDTGPDR